VLVSPLYYKPVCKQFGKGTDSIVIIVLAWAELRAPLMGGGRRGDCDSGSWGRLTVESSEKDSEALLGVWLPAPLPTPRALPDHAAIWPLAVGVEKDLGGIDV